ncbi:MAG: Arginyl-tRNA--protein transferase 1 [Vezdaea aestivalis]|nr:MAG: Arginyl-tRNA--protein transferase 1 [Vezdaea aestivalis]
MKYKGDYKPQFILDPETYDWDPLWKYSHILDTKKYVSLSHEESIKDSGPEDNGPVSKENADPETNSRTASSDRKGAFATSVFTQKTPGLSKLSTVMQTYNLEEMRVLIGDDLALVQQLQGWDENESEQTESLTHAIAEFGACIGKDLAGPEGIVIEF